VGVEQAEFVAARYAPLVRAARLLGCPPPDAEDAAQDALVRCVASWPRVAAAGDPEAYSYRVLVNVVARRRRRRWQGEVPHADPGAGGGHPGIDALGDAVAVRTTVAAALDRLAPAHRQVVVLRFFADLSEARTATVLGIAPGTVKSRSARALARLAVDVDLADLLPRAGRET
jgi:RNA polymerase sigma-70 factor (sigma-E family)